MDIKDIKKLKDCLDALNCESYILNINFSDNSSITLNKSNPNEKKIGY